MGKGTPETQDVVRDDFQRVRKGWDPAEVREHLEHVLSRFQAATTNSTGGRAAERVGEIVEAAERSAAEIERDAKAAAKRLRQDAELRLAEAEERAHAIEAEAKAEAEQLVAGARAEAVRRITAARQAVAGLFDQAQVLRDQIDADVDLDRLVPLEQGDRENGRAAAVDPAVSADEAKELLEHLRSGGPIPSELKSRAQ